MTNSCSARPLLADSPPMIPRLALLLLVAAILPASAADSIPKSFSASIGGFFGPSYQVELKDGKLYYRSYRGNPNRARRITITPTPEQWAKFRAALDAIHIWKWKARYDNQYVNDGTQWSLSITYDDRALTSGGSNSYPKKDGVPNNQPEFTRPFEAWLKAVRDLTGGREFQ